ncbi:MAG TPA: PDZ domain-containing protein [Fimbriimonadaceae bacterium]|nr:PDZ domain-containing protein [Fimbriimonadaceae bacterium]HRJ95727.1 PDZ domain-containing protein [Fimbriimonadaceae bacterium]
MLLSAVSLGLVLAGDPVQLSPEEQRAWDRIGQSCVVLQSGGFPTGTAILLDRSGHFMAHRSVVLSDRVEATLRSGKKVSLRLIFTDEPTQLSLLAADKWDEPGMAPVTVTDGAGLVGRPMLAALPTGPVRGEFVSTDRVGVVQPSKRYVPLSEIRFETPGQRFGGAMVFGFDGRLAGVLSATLKETSGEADLSIGRPLTAGTIDDIARAQASRFGPSSMTVGYSLGPEILIRVVEGFRSPSQRPIHPSIGCFFKDILGVGIQIEVVMPNSPAAVGGMQVGDVIVKAGDQTINTSQDLAVFLFRQKPGTSITLLARRNGMGITLPIVVGRAD